MSKTIEEYLRLPYQLIITPDEDGGYGVEITELPGCFTFVTEWNDIPDRAREAMQSWIGSALQHDEPIPEPALIASH